MGLRLYVFYDSWCPKCQMMLPVIRDLEKELKVVYEIVEVEMEKEPELTQKYGVEVAPTFVVEREQKVVGKMAGLLDETVLRERLLQFVRGK